MKTPREYQAEAHAAVTNYLMAAGSRDYIGSPLVVAPTGSGKSLMIAMFFKWLFDNFPHERWIMVTHDKRLIEQNVEELLEEWPEAPASIYCAGLKKKDASGKIVFASIQSIAKATALLGVFTGMAVDEAHMVPTKSTTMYRTVINKFRMQRPSMPVVGWTATPFRLGTGHLHTGPDRMFTDIVYDIPISLLIEQHHLAPVITKGGLHKLNLDGIGKRGGEFIDKEINAAVLNDETFNSDAIDEIIRYGAERKSWVIFAASIDHCEEISAGLKEKGIDVRAVHSKNSVTHNASALADLRAGRIRGVVNKDILTTGFNHPALDLIVFLRPTNSAGLYVQMVGRGMRTHPNKTETLVLDFARNVERHGPIDLLKIKDPTGKGGGDAPAKECPKCQWVGPTGTHFCPECGYEFEFEAPEIDLQASEEAILSNQLAPVKAIPTRVTYMNTNKSRYGEGKLDTMKVTYLCGFKVYNEWVCAGHEPETLAGRKATRWFDARQLPRVYDVDEAVEMCNAYMPTPEEITIEKDGDFDRISRVILPEVQNGTAYRAERNQARTNGLSLFDDDLPF